MYKPTIEHYKDLMVDFITMKNNHVFLCLLQEEIVGILSFTITEDVTEIIGLATLPDYRNLGIGKFLISYLKQNRLASKIYSEADVDGVSFYEKCEFATIPKIVSYSDGNITRLDCTWC